MQRFLQALPYHLLKKGAGPAGEAPFHAALWALLRSCVPTQVAVLAAADARGSADIFLSFPHAPVVWVLQLGVNSDVDAKMLAQAKEYAKAPAVGDDVEVVCCAIAVSKAEQPAASVNTSVGDGADTYVAKLSFERIICGKEQCTKLPAASAT